MAFGHATVELKHLEAAKFKAFGLEAADYFTDESALNAIGFYKDESSFLSHGAA